jgi:cobalamin biosynthesis Co2+ chelatase CbiK
MIRAKLARQGRVLDSPETAMARLMDEGFTHLAVLSLHTVPGAEFHELQQNAGLFGRMAGGFQSVRVARPLLSSGRDLEAVARILLAHLPGRKAGEAADSWKSILAAKGFKVEPILRGTAEIPAAVDLWLEHLKSEFERF